jgi:hypothetical protein
MNTPVVVILIPAAVLVLGVLVYALATNPKTSELGKIAYFVGLLWLVYVFAAEHVRF